VWSIVGGVVLAGLIFAAALSASVLVSLANSVCNPDPALLAERRHSLRLQLLITWTVAAAPFVLLAVVGRLRRRVWWPWLVPAAGLVVLGAALALDAEPGTFCF
jgi:hypothetical protein